MAPKFRKKLPLKDTPVTMDILMKYLGDSFFLILLLSLPAVLVAAVVGLVIGILQAVTQVQEQTIPAAPKILLVFMLLIFGGPLMLQAMEDFTREGIRLGTEVITHQEEMVLPPKPMFAYKSVRNKQAEKEAFFKEEDNHPSQADSKIKAMQQTAIGGQKNTSSKPFVNKPEFKNNMRPRLSPNDIMQLKRQQQEQRQNKPPVPNQ